MSDRWFPNDSIKAAKVEKMSQELRHTEETARRNGLVLVRMSPRRALVIRLNGQTLAGATVYAGDVVHGPVTLDSCRQWIKATTTPKPCEWCNDSGRMHDRNNDEFFDATTDCTHCEANSRNCPGCTYEMCPCHAKLGEE